MGRDWFEWHTPYADASSALSRRLAVVQAELGAAFREREGRPLTLISMCAGQGDDMLGAIAQHGSRLPLKALLVESDPRNAAVARRRASEMRLSDIEVLEADAGSMTNYAGFAPADIVMACGVFGNVSDEDVFGTIDALPRLVRTGATVIWTRSRREPDLTPKIRQRFITAGFREVAFVAPSEDLWSVGVNRFTGEPERLVPGTRMFTFE